MCAYWRVFFVTFYLFVTSFWTVLMCLPKSPESYLCSRNRCLSSLQWYSKSCDVAQIRLILIAWMYGILSFNDFECSDSIWRKLCRLVCFLYILVWSLLFLIYMSLSRKGILVFEVLYSNLFESCFVFNSSNFQIGCYFSPVHVKNISSMNIN